MTREQRIKAEQDAYIAAASSERLLLEIEGRILPILTHERPPSYMRIPADHEADDDVFVMARIQEIRRRLFTITPR